MSSSFSSIWQKVSQSQSTLFQLLRYGLVGGVAFVVDYGLLYVLTEFCSIDYLWSACFSFIAGLVVNYLLSNLIVFNSHRVDNRIVEFLIFAAIGGIGLALNEGIMYICTQGVGFHYMLSKIVSTVVVFFWNFFARKYALFQTNNK